jgi:hypothetical protein
MMHELTEDEGLISKLRLQHEIGMSLCLSVYAMVCVCVCVCVLICVCVCVCLCVLIERLSWQHLQTSRKSHSTRPSSRRCRPPPPRPAVDYADNTRVILLYMRVDFIYMRVRLQLLRLFGDTWVGTHTRQVECQAFTM